MKKYLLGRVLIMLIAFGCSTSKINKNTAQADAFDSDKVLQDSLLKKDTFNYIRNNFVAKKRLYIGKSLNDLIKDLPYKVESYLIGSDGTNSTIAPNLVLSFISKELITISISQETYPVLLYVTWETPVPVDIAIKMRRAGKGKWLESEKQYYGQRIVKDLELGYRK